MSYSRYISTAILNTATFHNRPNNELKGRQHTPFMKKLLHSEGPIPLPYDKYHHLSCEASIENGSLLITVRGPCGPHEKGKVFSGETMPLVTFAISRHGKYGTRLWKQLCELANNDVKRPSAPWSAMIVHETAVHFSDFYHILDDFRDGMGCAWLLYRRPEIQENQQRKQ